MNRLFAMRKEVLTILWNDTQRSFANVCNCLGWSPKRVLGLAKKLKLRRRKQHPLDRVPTKW